MGFLFVSFHFRGFCFIHFLFAYLQFDCFLFCTHSGDFRITVICLLRVLKDDQSNQNQIKSNQTKHFSTYWFGVSAYFLVIDIVQLHQIFVIFQIQILIE